MRPKSSVTVLLGLLAAAGIATCCWHRGRPPAPPPVGRLEPAAAAKDLGARAYGHVARLVSFGPRHTGSPGWYRAIAYIKQELNKLGLKPERDRWVHPIENITFENIWVTFPGKTKERLVIACHHDTKCCAGHPDPAHNFQFVGANDSGSGVGLLLALAKELRHRKNIATIQLVFFDGEESIPFQWDLKRALFGSRRFLRRYQQQILDLGGGPRIRALILLDMVGAKDLSIDDETNSDRRLHEIFRRAAKACGHERYFFKHRHAITDDHIPFLDDGIPAIDLIDLYDNPQWHTVHDTLEHISAHSLQVVGEVVLTALPGVERQMLR
jgi:glutaminyl-peptide cyclotransferase